MRSHLASVVVALSVAASVSADSLPIVDLPAFRQQATSYNSTGDYYAFNNIRFAQAPVGDLRWRAPKAPKQNQSLQTGTDDRICHQAGPAWFAIAEQFIPAYLTGKASQFYASQANGSSTPPTAPTPDPRENEDCLFLDVAAPKKIFDKRGDCSKNGGKGAAVLVWIYGGGYTTGSKSSNGNPAGLLARASDSQGDDGQGVVFVAMNYRLGAFGWLGGPTLQASGKANAGLLDQRFALDWVRDNIHLFGGDSKRVTIVGESAGGGSIMHQITAYGGHGGKVPFQQAVPQSPAFLPIPSTYQQENTTNNYLGLLNLTTIDQLRAAPVTALAAANAALVGLAPYGSFVFGPTVDGDFVTQLPGQALLEGHYHKDVKVMVGHNADEGLLFTSPFFTNDAAVDNYLKLAFPVAQPDILKYIASLYPPPPNAALGYADEIGRVSLLISESFFACNANYLTRAFGNNTFAYLFTGPPGLHGQDTADTFFGSGTNVTQTIPIPVNETVAFALQNYITDFVQTGAPSGSGVAQFNAYGADAGVQELGSSGIQRVNDITANPRCLWWQKALYF